MVDINKYKIIAHPAFPTVAIGAEVTYVCAEARSAMYSSLGPRDTFQWLCYNDRAMVKKHGLRRVYTGPRIGIWKNAKWTHVGRHTIKCLVTFTNGVKCYYDYPQCVDTTDAVLGSTFAKAAKRRIPSPYSQHNTIGRYINILKAAAKKCPPKGSAKDKHERNLKQYNTYYQKLGERLNGTWKKQSWAIPAIHLEKKTQKKSILRLRLVLMEDMWRNKKYRLIDWTNPAHPSLTGVYEGEGAHHIDAIKDAFKTWDKDNEYPPGHIRFKVPKWVTREFSTDFSKTFITDGKSFWGAISDFFNYIALGAGIIAGIITLVAPIPGSRVVSGLIWTSIFSSTVSATINIGQRYSRGFSNWKEDSLDVLTIVGNIFSGGWMRGAKIAIKNSKSLKYSKFCLVGQFSNDGLQGIIIAVDFMEKYDAIMNNKSLAPEKRTKQLLELFRSLVVAGGMTYISLKGTKKDLANLNKNPKGVNTLKKLKNPEATVEIDERVLVKGNTRNKKHKTKVQDEQIRGGETRGQRTSPTYTSALAAKERGMRLKDDQTFAAVAREKGLIIIVRNSNKSATRFIGKRGYKPKPMEMKAKTRKKPPFEGLAAADPQDPRFQQMMDKDGCSSPREWVDKNLGKDWTIDSKERGYVIRDPDGNAFFSDYDLHGVYHERTGKNAYTEDLKSLLNEKLNVEMIQHGPHDVWPDRNDPQKAGQNYGPQGDSTAYLPDGTKVHLETIEQMKSFYQQHNINWKEIYPNH